jgi:hypothetical protein
MKNKIVSTLVTSVMFAAGKNGPPGHAGSHGGGGDEFTDPFITGYSWRGSVYSLN